MKNQALIEARHKAGFTQKQVADNVGIAEVSYQRLEYGQKPSLRTAIRIADLLNEHTGFKDTVGQQPHSVEEWR